MKLMKYKYKYCLENKLKNTNILPISLCEIKDVMLIMICSSLYLFVKFFKLNKSDPNIPSQIYCKWNYE